MASLADHPVGMLVHENIHDFNLFPEEGTYNDYLPRESLSSVSYSSALPFQSSTALDHQYQIPALTSFEALATIPAYSSGGAVNLFEASQFLFEGAQQSSKANQFGSRTQNSPSGSASLSFGNPPSIISSASGASVPSAASSAMGSPSSQAAQLNPASDSWSNAPRGLSLHPGIVQTDSFSHESFSATDMDQATLFSNDKPAHGYVDPALTYQLPAAQPVVSPPHGTPAYQHQAFPLYQQRSPLFSPTARPGSAHLKAGSPSPYLHTHSYQPYPTYPPSRRVSLCSNASPYSTHSSPRSGSLEADDESREKGRCPNPECGKIFKDLKAHMLTHQLERPEKCPIVTCEYHQKGFARKYDKNRHTLTHYKGTMVCGFCPGSGSAAEKSFNRADVFKRHLTSVHGVEQTPPNSRKKSTAGNKFTNYAQDATGKCSTCSGTFSNAQDFYEHLDDCVLRVVQQEDPSEAINQRNMATMNDDEDVKKTLRAHSLPTELTLLGSGAEEEEDEEEQDDEDKEDDGDENWTSSGQTPTGGRSGKGSIKTSGVESHVGGGNNSITKANRAPSGGTGRDNNMTFSKGGVPLLGRGRKKRKNFPLSWGCAPEKMKMKKRVVCVFDGQRRLWKDDMMLGNDFEVRVGLADGKSYVTDLDVKTLERTEAFHNSTEDERGPFVLGETMPEMSFDDLMS